MEDWLNRVNNSLLKAIQVLDASNEIPPESMYILAPLFYSQENNMENEQLLREMCQEIEEQFKQDCSHDDNSKFQYKFHYVSSYLHCYVVAGKIDEMKCDRIMEYVNSHIELFEDG